MGDNSPPVDTDPLTVSDWFSAIVHTPDRWDLALALIPVALVLGVLLGGTLVPMWAGVTVGTGIALAATGYVVTVATPG